MAASAAAQRPRRPRGEAAAKRGGATARAGGRNRRAWWRGAGPRERGPQRRRRLELLAAAAWPRSGGAGARKGGDRGREARGRHGEAHHGRESTGGGLEGGRRRRGRSFTGDGDGGRWRRGRFGPAEGRSSSGKGRRRRGVRWGGLGRGESTRGGGDGRRECRRWLCSSSARPARVRKEKGRENIHGSAEIRTARERDGRGSPTADAWRRRRRCVVAAWARVRLHWTAQYQVKFV